MNRRGLHVVVVTAAISILLIPALPSLTTAQQTLPYDYHAIFRTHMAHASAPTTHPGAKPGSGSGGGGTVNFGGTPYNVGPTVSATTSIPAAEEEIAVSPTNSNALVAMISDFSLRGGFNTSKYSVSTDNGSTWHENFVPLSGGFPATSDGQTWEANSDPVVAIDNSGNVYLANLYLNASNNANGFYVSTGTITGSSLSVTAGSTIPVATNLSPTTSVAEDKEWIAVDNSGTTNNVYVSWTHFTASSDSIFVARSTDHGSTWSAPVQINPTAQNGAVQGSAVAVGPDGSVYVVYEVFFVGSKRQQFLAKSTDGGVTFSTATAITPQFNELSFRATYRLDSFAALAASPDGNVYVVYSDQPSKSLGAQVEFVASTNGGATFTSPLALNDSSKGQQFMPAVTTDEAGNIHASWFDTRNSGSSTSTYDIYATRSLNGGSTFSPNARVTPTQDNAGSASFIGDYAGIGAGGGSAHPVWTNGGFNNGSLQTAALQ